MDFRPSSHELAEQGIARSGAHNEGHPEQAERHFRLKAVRGRSPGQRRWSGECLPASATAGGQGRLRFPDRHRSAGGAAHQVRLPDV